MRKFTAIVVTAALIFSMLISDNRLVRPVEASLVEKAIAMAALVVEVGLLIATQTLINEARNRILDATKDRQDRAILEQRFDTTMYAHDHRPLSDDNIIDPAYITNTLSLLGLSGGNDISFFTGRSGAASPADFPGDYKNRADSLADYADKVNTGNTVDMIRLVKYQTEALEPMVEALFAGVNKDDLRDVWEGEYDEMLEYHLYMLPYSTARPTNFKDADDREDFLDDEILTGPGYRQTIQASGQISNMKNHLMASVRASLARQTEADVKYAHNEQQERADSHFAFRRSVGSWNSSNGTDY
jgi:hypothetical protein